ncbi:hypothetical protein BO94DRAFT_468940 [Aspergillus sclerotioniger CBS 115572]|uniref:BZIP domain-containing protein n=1 Tax=Aspergillus sclerotioniger CBS 115572 TaxID=1450535 RepID=A0A317WCQ7_9EURO|nr:hypothetical protein BO94DRAFT_468940 [Aspergillus sclerotioniger CBS 115572]PWY83695.1 hypothetical protein BO94DRAFT_468940 [Aspergillus sclerotioniger CBS 115572]
MTAKPSEDQGSKDHDKIERRKRQNRINQRTYHDGHDVSAAKPHASLDRFSDKPLVHPRTDSLDIIACYLAPRGACERAVAFRKYAFQSYITGSPKTDHLLTLTKINVHRALVENMAALGMDMNWMNADAVSPFCTSQPWPPTSNTIIPAHLRPTDIQCTVPHHPWLDFFPHPRMRDQLIAAGDGFDDEQLCTDIMGFWSDEKDSPGLVIWGNPWEVGNWELSEGFLRKWGWAVRGCTELIRSTNYWRAMRGEKRLSMHALL